jgi:uncharacterized membrane protein YgdD (TMEM256/DUF423 family)
MDKKSVATGIVFITIAIILGAFGAHGLKGLISAEKIASFEVGARYQMYHGLALLAIGLQASNFSFQLKWIYFFLFVGTILFSVSIYFLAIQEILGVSLPFLGPITPLGGSLLIVGWLIFLVKILRTND